VLYLLKVIFSEKGEPKAWIRPNERTTSFS